MVAIDITIRLTIITPVPSKSRHPASDIIDALAPLIARQRHQWAQRCHAHGLSIVGFHLLALLEMHGDMPMTQVAAELGVALPNATGIVSRMAERGLVARAHDDIDRRVVRVDLTNEGTRLVAELETERRDRMQRLIGQLDAHQQERLLQAVTDLQTAAARLAAVEEPPS